MKEFTSQFTQEAYDKLRTTLEFSEEVDVYTVLSNANTRINRLQSETILKNNESSISIGPKSIRKMALLLLDDEHGINVDAYTYLSAILIESGNEDVLENVDIEKNQMRAYIGEDYAETELAKLENEEVETVE